MSVNTCTNDDLDLNSDAVTLDEQNEVSMVNVSESTITVSISATETITELSNDQCEVGGSSAEGVIEKVRVFSRVGNSVEALVQGSDVCVDGSSDRWAEGNLNEDAGQAGLVKEGVEGEMEPLGRRGDETKGDRFDVLMSQKVCFSEDDDGKPGSEVAKKVEFSTTITESLGEQTQVVVGGEAALMGNEEVLSPTVEVPENDALNVSLSCSGKDQNLKVDIVCGSMENDGATHEDPSVCAESSLNGELSNEEDLSPKVKVPETNELDVNLYCSGNDQNLKVDMVDRSTENNSATHEDPSVCAESSLNGELSNDEDLSPKVEVLEIDALDANLYCSGNDQNLKVDMVGGSTENDSAIHEDHSVCAESRLNGGLSTSLLETNSDSQEDNTSMQHEKQEMVAQVAETLFSKIDGDQSRDSSPLEEIPNQGTRVTVSSISFAGNADGSQASSAYAFLHGEGEPYSSRVTEESVGPLPENNLDAEVQGVESISNGDLRVSCLGTNLDCQEENISVQDEKQEMVAQVDETLIKVDGDPSADAYPVEELPGHGTCDIIDSNSFAENIVVSQAAVACASPHSEGDPDYSRVTEFLVPSLDNNSDAKVQGVEYISNGDLRTSFIGTNSDSQEVNTSVQDEKQETFAQVAETLLKVDGNQCADSYRIEEILDQGTCVTVNSNLFAEKTVESQTAVAVVCASSRGEDEPDSSRVSEFVEPLHPGAEVQGVESIRTPFLGTNSDSKEENTFMVDEKQETIAQVAETLSNKLDGDQSLDSNPIAEILDPYTCATVNTNSFAEVTVGSQVAVAVACASSRGEGEPDSSRLSEFVGPFPDCNPGAEVQGIESIHNEDRRTSFLGTNSDSKEENTFMQDEKQETIAQVAETLSNKLDGDQSLDSYPIAEILDPYTCATVNTSSFAEVTVGSQVAVAVACASSRGEGEPDSYRVSEFVGSLPDRNPGAEVQGIESIHNEDRRTSFLGRNSDSKEENTFMQEEKQETIAQVAETLSNKLDGDQSLDSYPNAKILDPYTCATVNTNSLAEVTVGSQVPVAYASLHVEGEPDSALVTEFVALLPDSNLAAEVQITDTCDSLPHEDQNMHTHVSEFVTNHEVPNQAMEAETKAKGGCCETDANQIMRTHASEAEDSQLSGDESNTGSLVVDLDTCPITDRNCKSGDEVVKEDIYPPDGSQRQGAEVKEKGGYVGFSMLKCVDQTAACDVTQVGSNGNQEIDTEEQVTDLEQPKGINKKIVKQGDLQPSCVKEYQASYCLPPESESKFSVRDLVWGKVRSHPWWPGQIFDPSESSEKANKYHKKDSFLVAYFGDRTFAWNEASQLKPFHTHFSQMENQSNVEAFHDAVGCALKEVSRRVELGLACSCMSEEDYAKIKSQIFENTGIREESSRRDCVYKSTSMIAFEPEEFVKYIKALAQFPFGGGNKLELVIAQAQLLAFYRSKGYCRLPEFQVCGGLLDNDAVSSFSGEKKHSDEVIVHATSVSKDEEQVPYGKGKSKSQGSCFRKRKHDLKDSVYPSKKERSLSELMAGEKVSSYVPHGQNESDGKSTGKSVSLPSGKKRKAIDSFSEDSVVQNRKKGLPSPGASNTVSPSPKQSFKVGECIRRVASQLTRSPPILKCSGERFQKGAAKVDGSRKKPAGTGFGVCPDEMLSQLCLAARDPLKGYSFLTLIISFFSDFRNSVSLDQSDSGKHRKSREKVGGGKTGSKNKLSSDADTGSAETFAFVDMKDSYWTDMIIQSSPEEEPSRKNRNRKGVSELESPMENDMPFDEPETSPRLSPNWDSKPRNSDGNQEMTAEKQGDYVDVKCREDFSPTALILSFAEVDSVPSETNLNKIFNRFGPLRESETVVLRETSCATVVFKRRSDAEVAFSSAGKFSIFGPVFVSYQLRYLSSTPSKASSGARTQVRKDATSMEGHKT